MAELHGVGVAAVFAADAKLDAGTGLVALRARNLDELADAGLVNRGERWWPSAKTITISFSV